MTYKATINGQQFKVKTENFTFRNLRDDYGCSVIALSDGRWARVYKHLLYDYGYAHIFPSYGEVKEGREEDITEEIELGFRQLVYIVTFVNISDYEINGEGEAQVFRSEADAEYRFRIRRDTELDYWHIDCELSDDEINIVEDEDWRFYATTDDGRGILITLKEDYLS